MLQLDYVVEKLCLPVDKGGYECDPQEAQALVQEYLGFLQNVQAILKANPGIDLGEYLESRPELVSPELDVIWQTHILFTERYAAECQELFGQFLHYFRQAEARSELDFSPMIQRLMAEPEQGGFGWEQAEAEEIALEYKAFFANMVAMIAAGEKGKPEGLNPLVDIFWHTHVLFTRKYANDCRIAVGKFIHHQPELPSESNN